MAKRFFDLFWACLGLLLIWPLFVVVALLIKLEDGRSVFFRQERVGRDSQAFRIWKFRTMRVGADRMGPAITVGADPRITRVGRWLRASKVDELPQLLNVWTGEMSLVGPRPEVRKYVDLYSEDQRKVLALRPGITDPASIKYRNEGDLLAQSECPDDLYVGTIMPDKIQINLAYAQRANLWSDVRVIFATLGLGRLT